MASLGIDLGDTLGATFVGLAGNLVLSGVSANMLHSYLRRFGKAERKGHAIVVRSLCARLRIEAGRPVLQVVIVALVAWVNTLFIFSGCYVRATTETMRNADVYQVYIVYNFDNLLAVLKINWQLASHSTMAGAVILPVQAVFAYKCFVMSGRKWWIPLPIALLSITNFAFCIASSRMMLQQKSFPLFHQCAIWRESRY
jgi:hypothetical protein